MRIDKFLDVITDSSRLMSALDHNGLLGWLSDKRYLELISRLEFGKPINFDNPQTFNEKLNYLKLYDRNPQYTLMADKYSVKKFVSEKNIDGLNVAKCYGVWTSFDEIDFGSLPAQFVLKATHDSSGATIVRDKSVFNYKEARRRFNRYLRHNNFRGSREWVYKDIPPRIIAEEFIDDGSGHELTDYKFWCFNGVPKVMYITNKGSEIYENFYDMDFCPVEINHGFPRRKSEYMKPPLFDRMKDYAQQLSANIPFVRVDFFCVNGMVYFGEFTFYDWAGLRPFSEGQDEMIGEWLELKSFQ